jgi:drug/metabolite transporter (DMT)-like permease
MTRDRPHGALGLGVALFSAATFGTSGTFADALMTSGWTPAAVVTTRIALAALLLTIPALIAVRGRWALLRQSAPSILAFGLVAIGGCQLFYFNAVEHLDVGVALLLEYVGILLVVLWMWLRHGHRPRVRTIAGGVAATVGLLFVIHPGPGGLDPIGVMWALFAACGLAVYFVMSSKTDEVLPPIVFAWAGMVVGAVLLLSLDLTHAVAFHAETSDVALHGHRVSWLIPIVGLALLATALAYASGIAAARLLGAKVASFVGLTEVLFAVLIAWLALAQAPSGVQLFGGLVVLVGIALVRADETDPPVPAPDDEVSIAAPAG